MPPKLTAGSLEFIEERRLQNSRREVDVVHAGVVIGVHRRRSHAPFPLVYRLAQLVEVALRSKFAARWILPSRSSRFTTHAGVVPPVLGIADLVPDQRQLLFGLLLGRVDIHCSCWMSCEPAPYPAPPPACSMFALASGGKFLLTQSCPTASPRLASVRRVQRFQRGVCSFCPESVAW